MNIREVGMILRVTVQNKAILLALVGIFVLCSASFTLAEETVNAQVIPVYDFVNCNHSTISITVTAMHNVYTKEYILNGCTLVNETEQYWECFCEDSLNVTLESLQGAPKTYVYSISSVDENFSPTVPVPAFFSHETSSKDPLPSELVVSSDKVSIMNKLTGAVVGSPDFSMKRWGLILFVVILFSLLINVRFVDLPWLSRQERARRLHKHGKRMFAEGEHKRAEKYYAKAAKLRTKK